LNFGHIFLNYYLSSNGSTWNIASGVSFGNISVNTWIHVALVRNGSTFTPYLNGVAGTTSTSASAIYTNTSPTIIGAAVNPTVNSPFTGYISNLRIVNGTAVYTATFTPPTSPLTAIANTSLLTCQSPTFIDNSTNNFTITAAGDSKPTIQNPFGFTSATTNGYTPSTIGGSGYFDGTGDNLITPNNSALALGAGDFTVEANFYLTTSNTAQCILDFRTAAGSSTGFFLGIVDSGKIQVWNGGSAILSNAIVTTGRWYHLAIVRKSTTLTAYLDGVAVATNTSSSTNFTDNRCSIGSSPVDADVKITGYLSDVRVVKGTAVYISNFVPPTQPLTAVQNTVLLTNMTSAGIYDAAMMNNMETVADAKLSTAVSKFGGSSMSFDGTGDYLILPAGQTGAFNTGNFTIEFWFYATTVAIANQAFIAQRTGDTVAVIGWSIRLGTSTFAADISNGSTNYTLTHQTAVSANSWNHGALVRSGTSITLYLNGVANSSPQTVASNYILNGSGSTIYIGYASSGSVISSFNGYMDDLRITKGYARYTSNFTPPTSAFQLF